MAFPRPDDRRAAKRMWLAGCSRASIAATLKVQPNTVSHWRWQDGWPARRHYTLRPITPPTARKRPIRGSRGVHHYACPHCGTRSALPEGHASCAA